MATLLRRRDEHDEINNESDVEVNDGGKQQPVISPDYTLEEPGSKIWGPYLELADKYNKDFVHNWRDDMDSLPIFAAPFSASVTAFVIESYKTLVQDSRDVTVEVLLQISRQLANGTQAPSAVRPTFQPDSTDIAINIFWFLSLAFSLACALAAALVRQWARKYLRFPRSFSSTIEQARARQFLFENMVWWKMELVVEAIPALLHISLILLFIGLLLFVHSINVTLAIYLLYFGMTSEAAYAFITVAPLLFPGCPYKTPFSVSVGLAVHIAKPSMNALWTFVVVSLACLIFLLSSTLSALIRWCLPSTTIPVSKLAMHVSQPIRSSLSRHLGRLRGMDYSFRGMGGTTRKTMLSLVHLPRQVFALTTSWTSTVSSLRNACLSLSKSLVERQQSFRNEICMRDARALRWTMDLSKKNADLFTIITSVPEFVQMNDSGAEIRLVMWNSGIVSQTLRLLRTSAIDGSRVTNRSIFLRCLESIIWSTPCATDVLDQDSAWIGIGALLPDDLTHDIGEIEWQNFRMNWETRIFECARSNLLLRWVYLLERRLSVLDEEQFRRNYKTWRNAAKVLWNYLRGRFHLLPILSRTTSNILLGLFYDLAKPSRMEFSKLIGEYRTAWSSNIFFHDIQSSLTFDVTIWSSLCDSATHLPPYPFPVLQAKKVLFGGVDNRFSLDAYKPHHFRLQVDFFSRVHVYHSEGPPFQLSVKAIEITFEAYCAILDDLVTSSQMKLDEYLPPLAEESSSYDAAYEDVIARTIRKIIRYRLRSADECNRAPNFVDAQHLTVARHVCHYTFVDPDDDRSMMLSEFVERIADEFGYAFQLEENYNIEMHAELQYYEPGIYGQDIDLLSQSRLRRLSSVTSESADRDKDINNNNSFWSQQQ